MRPHGSLRGCQQGSEGSGCHDGPLVDAFLPLWWSTGEPGVFIRIVQVHDRNEPEPPDVGDDEGRQMVQQPVLQTHYGLALGVNGLLVTYSTFRLPVIKLEADDDAYAPLCLGLHDKVLVEVFGLRSLACLGLCHGPTVIPGQSAQLCW